LHFSAVSNRHRIELEVPVELEEEISESIELVTLHSDLGPGVTVDDHKPFQSLDDALAYAKTLGGDERQRSWLRRGKKIQSLDDAETELGPIVSKPASDPSMINRVECDSSDPQSAVSIRDEIGLDRSAAVRPDWSRCGDDRRASRPSGPQRAWSHDRSWEKITE
jgi:hypothetical protein